jgi:hypothetical protein
MRALRVFTLFVATLLAAPFAFSASANAAAVRLCGAVQRSVTITYDVAVNSTSTTYELLPGTRTVINVPAGQTRCLKVLFTAASLCGGQPAAVDYCLIRAVVDGVEMNPRTITQFDSENTTGAAHALSWVKAVGPGQHIIAIQRRVNHPNSIFQLIGWTMDLTITY